MLGSGVRVITSREIPSFVVPPSHISHIWMLTSLSDSFIPLPDIAADAPR